MIKYHDPGDKQVKKATKTKKPPSSQKEDKITAKLNKDSNNTSASSLQISAKS